MLLPLPFFWHRLVYLKRKNKERRSTLNKWIAANLTHYRCCNRAFRAYVLLYTNQKSTTKSRTKTKGITMAKARCVRETSTATQRQKEKNIYYGLNLPKSTRHVNTLTAYHLSKKPRKNNLIMSQFRR